MSDSFHQIGVIVVDIQGDFTEMKEGSLAVSGTDVSFIESIADAVNRAKDAGLTIFATQDWHPADHVSFYTNHLGKQLFDVIEVDDRSQVLWPPHCVQGTENAKILIDTDIFKETIQKGQDREFDSYSGFQDDGGQKTEMDSILYQNEIEKVVIFGIATDYCVKATALDAVQAGYKAMVIEELCRGVAPDTATTALEEMEKAGVIITNSFDIDMIKSS